MSVRLKPMFGAYIALYIVAYCVVRFIFAGMLPEPPFEPILSMPFALLVFAAVVIVFFDWVVQQWGNPVKTAIILTVSQILMVDVYYVLNGGRDIPAAVVSALILLVSAWAYGTAYAKLSS